MPWRHVALDTEAKSRQMAGGWEQTWLCAVAAYIKLPARGDPIVQRTTSYTEPSALWRDVAGTTRPGSRVVVWCHNLAYDLRISRAIGLLPLMGWSLRGIVLERTASWASFERDKATILFCDTVSWFPVALATLADDLCLPKQVGPLESADLDTALARCQDDVNVTARAVCDLLSWLRTETLGPFRPTGAGQSLSAFRSRFMSTRPFVHADETVRAHEREGAWTGRAEAWRHGGLTDGPYTEYDLSLAYCHIAHDCALPLQLVGRTERATASELAALRDDRRALAHVTVTTDQPTVPARHDGHVVWPVGTFTTTLFDPELRALYHGGATVEVHYAYVYRAAPFLRGMATWILDQLADVESLPSPVLRHVLKHWSRTIVGRMALRYREWDAFASNPEADLSLGLCCDHETGVITDMMQAGNDVFLLGDMVEARSSLPQVTGWVMSEARRRLWDLIQQAHPRNVVYMDTDSLIVTAEGADRLDAAIASQDAYSLRRKADWQTLTVNGPRNLTLESTTRISGVPKTARRVGQLDFDGVIWRGLKESLSRGELDHVALTPRRFTVSAHDPRRLHRAYGLTEPHRLGPSGAHP